MHIVYIIYTQPTSTKFSAHLSRKLSILYAAAHKMQHQLANRGTRNPKANPRCQKGGREERKGCQSDSFWWNWNDAQASSAEREREKKYCDGTNGVACIWVCCVQTRRQVFIARMRIMWQERGKGAAGKKWGRGGNERRQLLCLLFIQIFWCVYLACERKGEGRLKGNLVWIDICCLVCWAFAGLRSPSVSLSLPPSLSSSVCLSLWFNKLAREFSILLDFLLPFRLMFNMFYNVP